RRELLGSRARRHGGEAWGRRAVAAAGLAVKGTTMSTELQFDQVRLPPECEALRREVRAFLAEEIAAGNLDPYRSVPDDLHDPAFSRKVGQRGWIGMTWPKKYGGHERTFLERYVVTEEFRVANAPVRLHFVADRQSGPILLKYANERI